MDTLTGTKVQILTQAENAHYRTSEAVKKEVDTLVARLESEHRQRAKLY